MKNSIFFIFLIVCPFVSGQSAKKLNAGLRSQMSAAKTESDSITRVISQRKTNLSDSWLKLKKNEFEMISAHNQRERLLKDNIAFLYDVLTKLGDNPQQWADLKQIKETRIPLMESESVYRSYSYLFSPKLNIVAVRVPDTLILDKYKLKEENELIQKVLKQYADAKDSNLQSITTLTEYENDMKTFRVKVEAIYQQSTMAYEQLWNAYSTLMDRYSKLNADYLAKGPKAFPPVYKEEFEKAAMMDYPQLIAPVTRETNAVSSKSLYPKQEKIEVIEAKTDELIGISDIPAEYPGGRAAMLAYLSKNMVIPDKVKDTGKCYLKFIVSKTGEISDIKVMKGVPGCPECDAEAIRLVKGMPNWIPAKNKDKVVNSYFNLPIVFKPQ